MSLQALAREKPLDEVFACVLPYLPAADRATLRNVSSALRNLANGTCSRVVLSASPVFHTLVASQLLKRLPRVKSMEFMFNSPQEVKAATMFILTSMPDHGSQLVRLTFGENRAAAQQLFQQHQQGGGHSGGYWQPESRFQQYGYNSGAKGSPQTLDFTESILATVCSWSSVKAVSMDKTVLLETEAAALARLTGLHELRLATNSSAQPLRRPLLQLMLNSLTGLRVLKLSYIRDTTADMALSLPRLTHLTKLTFQYAYWGDSGAGERIMVALAKHQKELAELHLYESGVNDDMLRHIMAITTLRRLHIQDENAEEESCPTNKGLARITQLRRLEQLELFGEELQLDGEILALLAQLPALRYLAMAGLESLQLDDADSPVAFETAFEDLDVEVEEMELSSTMDGDEETEESLSGVSNGGDEATSRPQASSTQTYKLPVAGASGSGSGIMPYDQRQLPPPPQQQQQRPLAPRPAQRATAAGPSHRSPLPQSEPPPQQQQPPQPRRGTLGPGGGAFPAPLQVLRRLQTLRLYGPSSLCASPPPLALLLPQPQLRHLKLSACASHANLRALSQQSGLHKLIVSHTSVSQLYPPPGAVDPAAPGAGATADNANAPAHQVAGASILGFHSEVVTGLAPLRVLRIKDLPGLMDCHLVDLAAVLCRLPCLNELKLRTLGILSDAGIVALAAVSQLRRLKLYALGDGVTEVGVAHLAASLPVLEELKVKDCRRVGPSLRSTVAAYRAARAAAAGGQRAALLTLVVRYGADECEGARVPSA